MVSGIFASYRAGSLCGTSNEKNGVSRDKNSVNEKRQGKERIASSLSVCEHQSRILKHVSKKRKENKGLIHL